MKRFLPFILLFFTAITFSQAFNGTSGNVSDDGATNTFTANVTGLSGLSAAHGLVQVCLDITHTYNSDLNVHLIAPDGTEINLFSGIGGGDDNFSDTCLSQTAANSINTTVAPFSGIFRPQETLGNINNGQIGNGTWKLSIVDTYPDADTGTVNSWSIQFGPDASVPFVFTSSNLPIVIINTGGVTIPDDPKIDATMGIVFNGAGMANHITDTPNNYNGNIGIELRGNYSQGLPQKPYKIELRDAANGELDASILGMPAESDWCLIANYNDKVFMRNALAYKLFDEMGHYAPRNRFCEVVLNGNYQGVYLLTESIKRDNNRVDIAKLDTNENTGLNVTGGYIIKNDYWTNEDSWVLNYHPIGHPELDVRLVYEYPKPENITVPQKNYIQDYINDFETALYGPDFTNATTGYNKYIDKNSFVDYFIVNELSRNGDGFKKSCFFHKDIDTPAALAKLHAGPVWDFDWAWKNYGATDGSGWAYQVNDDGPDVNSTGWYVRLLQDTEFQNLLRCRWQELRPTLLNAATINNYIDETAGYLNEAQARHFDKWGNLGVNTGSPEVEADAPTFPLQLVRFKNWIALRLAWLDANIPGDSMGCDLGTDETSRTDMKLYPNPTAGLAYISGGQTIGKASLVLLNGMEIPLKITGDVIDISDYPAGIYFLKIITDEEKIFKVVKY